jgi:hypothetical protein
MAAVLMFRYVHDCEQHEPVGRWVAVLASLGAVSPCLAAGLVFPAWVLVVSLYILIDNLSGRPVRTKGTTAKIPV